MDDERSRIDDDAASHSTCETFSSDEDEAWGNDETWADFPEDLDEVKQNSRTVQRLSVDCPSEREYLDLNQWAEIGEDIGRNTRLQRMAVSTDGLGLTEDEHEMGGLYNKENLEAFCRGLAHNRSLRALSIQECDFSRARLAILHPVVVENHKLCELRLHQCNLDVADIEMLASAFRWRRDPTSMKTIEISGRTIGDDAVPMIVELCNCCPRLKRLVLQYSKIGNRGCRELTSLLEDRNTTLRCLNLEDNKFDEEGARALAIAVVGNNTLQCLGLGASFGTGTGRVSEVTGWEHFPAVVGDSSSINATYQSNHVLQRLWGQLRNHCVNRLGLPYDLLFSLRANKGTNKANAARKKIFYFHLRGDFDLAIFLSMDVEVLPTVLGWIGKDRGDGDSGQTSFSAFYRILRNIPELCGYSLSDRKTRLQLEAENATLQRQNEHLRREIEELRSSKRSRKD
ncbi:hypothetical protein ACHAXT_007997 [Thalassiosira profunda]